MIEIVLPPAVRVARSSFRYADRSGSSRSEYNGAVQTTSRGGDRVSATLDFTPHGGMTAVEKRYRAQIISALMRARGSQNRIYAQDNSNPYQGAFQAPELFLNAEFGNAATSWLTAGKYSLAAIDGGVRSSVTAATPASNTAYQSLTMTQFAPYVSRFLARAIRGTFTQLSPFVDGTAGTAFASTLGYGLTARVAQNASGTAGLFDAATSGPAAGDAFDVLFASASRCLLVDGGGNALVRSDEFGTTWTLNGATITTDGANGPDGTTTAEILVENTASNVEHYVTQTIGSLGAAAADYVFSVSIRQQTRGFAIVRMVEQTGLTPVFVSINLATGALGSVTNGSNWGNGRAWVVDQGGGWYRVSLVGRKTNAATSIACLVNSATSLDDFDYAGSSSTNAILLSGANFKQDSVPGRQTATTSAAVAAASQSGAPGIYVKGGRTSAEGALLAALLPGDWIECNGQILMVDAQLDLDASGRGYLQTSPPPRRSISDNTPVIICRPLGRFMIPPGSVAGWSNEPGVFSTAQLELDEAFA
jgi:hypothetical protein